MSRESRNFLLSRKDTKQEDEREESLGRGREGTVDDYDGKGKGGSKSGSRNSNGNLKIDLKEAKANSMKQSVSEREACLQYELCFKDPRLATNENGFKIWTSSRPLILPNQLVTK